MCAILFVLELINDFKDYAVKVPKITDSFKDQLARKLPFEYNKKKYRKRSSTKLTFQENDYFMIPIKIHISLACGKTDHVILGEMGSINRLEYCIGGPVVKESGELLNVAPAGTVVVSNVFWKILVEIISPYFNDEHWILDDESTIQKSSEQLGRKLSTIKYLVSNELSAPAKKVLGQRIAINAGKKFRLISEKEPNLGDFVEVLKSSFDTINEPNMHTPNPSQLKTIYIFMEESLAKSVTNAMKSVNPSEYELIQNFNQIRNIVSVFIMLKSIDITNFGSNEMSTISQKAMSTILKNTQKYGGCCRQFICDDKLTSVLLVWGMDGYAHEKGDTIQAVSAALEISKEFAQFMDDNFSIGVSYGPV